MPAATSLRNLVWLVTITLAPIGAGCVGDGGSGTTPLPDLAAPDLSTLDLAGTEPGEMTDLATRDSAPRSDLVSGAHDCSNTVRDGDETDVDCGGATCSPCADGLACLRARDCRSGQCVNGVCSTPTCMDGVLNQDETDIDCGGKTCSACKPGSDCRVDGDCTSGSCDMNVCAVPAQCRDGKKDGDETDIDCGGTLCGACGDGRLCSVGDDCLTRYCGGGICRHAPTCKDGQVNQDETDVDCGGATCPACSPPQACRVARDCTSMVCFQLRCASPSCSDGVKNGSETDVDCGGANCGRCANGQKCGGAGDCFSATCVMGVCQALPGLSFSLPASYPVTGEVKAVAVADFDGDKKIDIATGEAGGTGLSLLVGKGDGTFLAAVQQPANTNTSWLDLADFDNNGRPDLVSHYDRVQLISNLGGKFDRAVNITNDFINNENTAAIGDVNGDSLPDVLIANGPYGLVGSLRLFLNTNGTGATTSLLPSPVGSPRNAAFLDADKDGKLDLVVPVGAKVMNAVGPSYSLLCYHGNGDGTFRAPDIFAPAKVQTAGGLAVADINGDGNQDVVVASFDMVAMADELLTFLGKGDGTFGVPIHSPTGAFKGQEFYRLVAADFDGDGIPDVAGADPGNGVRVLRGKKDGSFQPGAAFAMGGASIWVLGTADFNGDGKPDLVSANYFSPKVWVILNTTM